MENISITSLNINFCNGFKSSIHRNVNEVVDELLIEDSTFIAIQEFGSHSMTNDIDGGALIKILGQKGYELIENEKKSRYPVNTCIFYKSCKVEFLEKLNPIYDKVQNRQCGARFLVNGRMIDLYSLHLPLYSNNKEIKIEFWKEILKYARKTDNDVILAGDFNESRLPSNPTMLAENIYDLENYFTDASTQEPTWRESKLDHIFISRNLAEKNLFYKTLATKISDHKKLRLDILL
ncbi:hypothetical protein GHI93_04660 [Lactococcus hircilactis]|uniref:Endonuclease/exonuclease/phosphatase domain-containing protein n=2 Tax=Lactococcus hircilactis TaxID=1494462 RepID=A0A7X1Z8H3_9LACT|nr:endonuclease/exonuclease/phosphatase family protein [Lactococcus hircilactis]MQW39229.1 hypothetical protein [Lactococcus hircilactis]